MNKKYLNIIIMYFFVIIIYAQKNKKAEKLLSQVTEKMKSYKNVEIYFNYAVSQYKKHNSENTGNILIQKDKYILDFLGTIQLFDGKNIYQILEEDEEINILPKQENDNLPSPITLLSFYKKGYHIYWDILQKAGGKTIRYIKLIPIDKTININYILMGINTETKQLYKLIQVNSDQTKITISINKYNINKTLKKSTFAFDKLKYKNYYINKVK